MFAAVRSGLSFNLFHGRSQGVAPAMVAKGLEIEKTVRLDEKLSDRISHHAANHGAPAIETGFVDHTQFREFMAANAKTTHFAADCETTGLDPTPKGADVHGVHRMVQFALVPVSPTKGAVGGGISWTINPSRPIPKELTNDGPRKVHAITDDVVRTAPPFFISGREIAAAVRDKTVIFHNADFDKKFLNSELFRINTSLEGLNTTLICSKKIAQSLQPQGTSASLDNAAKGRGIDLRARKNNHDALTDAKAVALLLPHLAREHAAAVKNYNANLPEAERLFTQRAPIAAHAPSAPRADAAAPAKTARFGLSKDPQTGEYRLNFGNRQGLVNTPLSQAPIGFLRWSVSHIAGKIDAVSLALIKQEIARRPQIQRAKRNLAEVSATSDEASITTRSTAKRRLVENATHEAVSLPLRGRQSRIASN